MPFCLCRSSLRSVFRLVAVVTTTRATAVVAAATATVVATSAAAATAAAITATTTGAAATVTTAAAATLVTATAAGTIVTAATAASGRALTVIGLFYHQGLFTQRNIIEVFNCVQPVLVVLHVYKSKPTAFTGFFIHGNLGRNDGTKFFENFHQLVVKQIVRKAGNKKFHNEN